MSRELKSVKIYTVEINRSNHESGRWYFTKKGQFFNCALIIKQTFNSDVLTPQFLVLEKVNDQFVCPALIRTIRPIDCEVVAEHLIESPVVYDCMVVFGRRKDEEELFERVRGVQDINS